MSIFNPKPGNTFLANLFAALPTPPGNVIITANTNLTSDMFAISLTVNAGATLYTDNCRIYVLTSLTNNGTISNVGNNGGNGSNIAGGLAGENPMSITLPDGAIGKNGVFNGSNGLSDPGASRVLGGSGTNGGNAGAFTGGIAGPTTPPHADAYSINELLRSFDIQSILLSNQISLIINTTSCSGAAAAGAAGSGGSGAGGGAIFIAAHTLTNNGLITVRGGNAGSPFNNGITAVGGSASGCGGIIALFTYRIIKGNLNTLAGTPSIGVNGGTNGQTGNSGFTIISTIT